MSTYLSDVLDIDTAILEHGNKLLVLAGVGAGKSTWVKETLSKKGSVLFVTSRKAKVEADVNDSSFSQYFHWHSNDNQLLITNAKLAAMVKNITTSNTNEIDSFLNHFDYIVIDEVHSIATDSTFAPSCSSVLHFIEYAVQTNKTVIAMTGTPEPIQHYFEKRNWPVLDYRNTCKYVHPEKIILTTSNSVPGIIQRHWKDRKIIYFANHTDTIINICKQLLESDDIAANNIATIVARSKEDKFIDKLKKKLPSSYKDIIKTSTITYENIISHNAIPAECNIMFSTSALKEGIDIWNNNIVMFCESHVLSNLIQFFGRARGNNCHVYVVEDAYGYDISPDMLICEYNAKYEVQAANAFWGERIQSSNEAENEKLEFISYAERSSSYLRFNYIKNEFTVFAIKLLEELRLSKKIDWKAELKDYCHSYNISFVGNIDMTKAMRTALLTAKNKKLRFYLSQKDTVSMMLKWAYNIEDKQPKKINEKLAAKKSSIRILNGTENKSVHRGDSYWQIISADEYHK